MHRGDDVVQNRSSSAVPFHPRPGPGPTSFPMKLRHLVIALGTVVAVAAAAPAARFADVLETPAVRSPLAARSLMQAVTTAGSRLVAVGQRGHVLLSDDQGQSWQQAAVPVSSDLVAVHFVDAKQGWVTAHDGVVLHTADGGTTWQLQLDGRKANELLVAAMERKATTDDGKALLAEAQRYREQGPDKPFLDVWFADASNGFVVGAYNLIFRTADGGKTWEPWFDRTDNPKFFNLYAIRPAADGLYIAGEGGLVLKLDPATQRFRALTLPYTGSFFGVARAQDAVLAFGLRGNVWRSDNGGAAWQKADAGLTAAVVAAATVGDQTLLADQSGRMVATRDGGRTFQPVTLQSPVPVTGIAGAGPQRLAITGPRGVAAQDLAAR